ncbi:IS1016 group transposase [Neisseria gonorrhoeae]|nr:IS1016 group transposase [Neisseria gonorrhoeae]
MLPSKYEDNTLQIKERSTKRTAPFFCTGSYRPFCRRYFGYPSRFRRHCFTVKSARLPTIVWPWLPMRFSGAPPGRAQAVSAGGVKADAVAARQEKRLSSAFRNATGGPIPLPRTMPSLKRCSLPSKRKSCRTVLFMPIARAAAASRTRAVLPVAASTVPRNLQTVGTTLTALGTFGIRQNAPCGNTTESIVNLSRRS